MFLLVNYYIFSPVYKQFFDHFIIIIYTKYIVGGPGTTMAELWNTYDNSMQTIDLPSELTGSEILDPVLVPYGKNSALLTYGKVNGNVLDALYQYTFNIGWKKLGASPSSWSALNQNGILELQNTDIMGYNDLNCFSS